MKSLITLLPRLAILILTLVLITEPISAQKPMAWSTKKIVIRKIDKSSGAANRPVMPSQDMNKPREEPVFLTLALVSDMDGTIWINAKSYPLEAGKEMPIPVPVSFQYFFLSADSSFQSETQQSRKFFPYEQGKTIPWPLTFEMSYQVEQLKDEIEREERLILDNLSDNMLYVGESGNYELCRVEVTVAEYAAFMKAVERSGKKQTEMKTGSSLVLEENFLPGGEMREHQGIDWRDDVFGKPIPEEEYINMPVVNVSWLEAVAFCEWLSGKDPYYEYRLPTVAEWESAASSGMTSNYPWGNDTTSIDKYANTADYSLWPKYAKGRSVSKRLNDSYPFISPTGFYAPNDGGFFDMIGNVREWCSDTYIDRSGSGTQKDVLKSVKGGSFFDYYKKWTIAYTSGQKPDQRSAIIGFRICRELKVPKK